MYQHTEIFEVVLGFISTVWLLNIKIYIYDFVNVKRIAILTENCFEETELKGQKKALEDAGADVKIVSPHDKVKGWHHDYWCTIYNCHKVKALSGHQAKIPYLTGKQLFFLYTIVFHQ